MRLADWDTEPFDAFCDTAVLAVRGAPTSAFKNKCLRHRDGRDVTEE